MPMVGRGSIAASEARSKASPDATVTFVRPKSRRQPRGRIDVLLLVIAQERRHRNFRQGSHRLEKVSSPTRRDIDDAHRAALRVRLLDHVPQQFLQVLLPLANAAPADAVQITVVDEPAERASLLAPCFRRRNRA